MALGCRLTDIDESAGCSFAELFGFVGESDFDDARNVTRRRLDPDSV